MAYQDIDVRVPLVADFTLDLILYPYWFANGLLIVHENATPGEIPPSYLLLMPVPSNISPPIFSFQRLQYKATHILIPWRIENIHITKITHL